MAALRKAQDDGFGFLAAHAGTTLEKAGKRLSEVDATGRFPDADTRKMQAKLARF